MKYIIWLDQEQQRFDFGDEERFKLHKNSPDRQIVIYKVFTDVSPALVQKLTTLLNRKGAYTLGKHVA